MKRSLTVLIVSIVGLALGYSGRVVADRLSPNTSGGIHAVWASSAETVADEVAEADIIVRVRVDNANATRAVARRLPTELQREHDRVDVIPYTDSEMVVLDIYKGTVSDRITVMQLGGSLPLTEDHFGMNLSLYDDPLYVPGSEHVLFLVDISGDPVHAEARKLYRVVNAAGRYDVHGDRVFTHAELTTGYTPPASLEELEAEIARVR